MVPEIRSETDRIFCHFGPLFSFFPNDPENQHFEKKNEKHAWRYYPFIYACVP